MKKILFVSHFMPPYLYPQSIQVGRFLKGLKGRFDVHILCASEGSAEDPTLYPNLYDGISPRKILKVPYRSVTRFDAALSGVFPFMSKCPDLYARWCNEAYKACLKTFPDIVFNAVVTFSFPFSLNMLGARLKEKYNCPWIAHQSDPWAGNPFQHFGPITAPINSVLERNAFRRADRLIFTCMEAADMYRCRYPEMQSRIEFINHSFDPELFPTSECPVRSRKIIRYIGSFYGRRTARPLLDAIEILPPEVLNKLCFEIVGANLKTRLLLRRYNLSPELVKATPRVNYAESLKLMVESDGLLVIDAPLQRDNIFFPSKLADYIGAGRPIIGITPQGPTDRILSSLGQPSFRHDQIREIAKAFERISEGRETNLNFSTHIKDYLDTANNDKLAKIINHV